MESAASRSRDSRVGSPSPLGKMELLAFINSGIQLDASAT